MYFFCILLFCIGVPSKIKKKEIAILTKASGVISNPSRLKLKRGLSTSLFTWVDIYLHWGKTVGCPQATTCHCSVVDEQRKQLLPFKLFQLENETTCCICWALSLNALPCCCYNVMMSFNVFSINVVDALYACFIYKHRTVRP